MTSIHKNEDRQVVLSGADNSSADTMLKSEQSISGLTEAVVAYTDVDDYTTFYAKYALKDGNDLIICFYPDKNFAEIAEGSLSEQMYTNKMAAARQKWVEVEHVWLEKFPVALNEVAQSHFRAEYPRLMAKYTTELTSWWFKAQGYSHIIDLDRFVSMFLEKLDAKLDEL